MSKRHIGMVVVSGLLACGAAVSAAGPSSAMPRNECLDEQHYLEAAAGYHDQSEFAFNWVLAYDNATHPGSVWLVYNPDQSGAFNTYYSYRDYDSQRSMWERSFASAANAEYNFLATTTIC